MKRFVALTTVLVMMLCLLTGCGSGSEPASNTNTVISGNTSDEAASDESPDTSVVVSSTEVSYPIADGTTLTAWCNLDGSFTEALTEWNDLYILPAMEKAIGVNLDITTVSSNVAEEQYPLMIASGDWPDMMPISNYTGGDEQAYEDEVITDLTDLLAEYAPDYWSKAQSMDTGTQKSLKSGDKYLTIYTLLDKKYTIQGTVIRQDWLDALGLSAPTTLDELTTVLKAFYDKYQPEYTVYTSMGSMDYLNDLFDTSITGYTSMTNEMPIYVDDDKVKCTYITDEYRAYIEWFAELYDYGIINKEFFNTSEMDGTTRNTNIAEGETGLWSSRCESIDEWKTYATDANELATCNPQPLAYLTNDDGTYNWGSESALMDDRVSWCITTECDNPGLALEFLNYFFTDVGAIMANYGEENYTWEYDGDDIAWTDIVRNNPDGYTAQLAVNVYTSSALLPCYSHEDKMFSAYSDNAQAAITLYNDNVSADHAYPSGAALTTAETSEMSGTVSEITTYASEQLLKFMTCTDTVTDDSWQAYVDVLNSYGINGIIETYQNAYDQYLSGKR